jgi:hypothetical protein
MSESVALRKAATLARLMAACSIVTFIGPAVVAGAEALPRYTVTEIPSGNPTLTPTSIGNTRLVALFSPLTPASQFGALWKNGT